jgi:hypothetical protein
LIKKYLVSGVLIVILASLAVNLYLTFTSEKYPEKVKVEVKINFGTSEKTETVEIQNGTTVFEVLDSITEVEYMEYSGMGKLVTSIDGVAQTETHSWMYYVNDEFAAVACDKYALTEDTSFSFKYMSNEEAMEEVS